MWFTHGYALEKLKQDAEAVASYDKAIAIDPDEPEAKQNRERLPKFFPNHVALSVMIEERENFMFFIDTLQCHQRSPGD